MFKFIFRLLGSAAIFKAGNKLQGYLLKPSDFEENMKLLDSEEWFSALRRDFRYDHIIRYNAKVRKVVEDSRKVAKLLEEEEEQRKFIELVQQEYIQLMKK